MNRRADEPVALLVAGADLENFLSSPALQTMFLSMVGCTRTLFPCRGDFCKLIPLLYFRRAAVIAWFVLEYLQWRKLF